MTDEHTGAGADPVIPPPAAEPGGTAPPFPGVVPMAPPLSAPAPAAPAQPAAHLPPYAAAAPPAPPVGGYPASITASGYPAPGGYPAAVAAPGYPAPATRKNSNALGIVLAVVGGFVVLAVVGVAMIIGVLLPSRDEAAPAPAPSPTAFAEDPGGPTDDEPTDTPSDVDTADVAERLEAKIDEYRRLRDSGALWQTIPDNEYNRTAVTAFLYLMTDMKVATIWGIDEQQAQEYDERMAMLEERLLAQEPFGDDITITLEDRIFTYDGETGEGGYTDK